MTASAQSTRASLRGRVCAWICRCQRQLSTWVHAAGDERARAHGWQVTETTGRLGLGGRRYRDPRFDHGLGGSPAPQPRTFSVITPQLPARKSELERRRSPARTTAIGKRATDMEWEILAALLLINGPGEQSHEPRLVVVGPCCGPPTRQAEPGGEREAGG